MDVGAEVAPRLVEAYMTDAGRHAWSATYASSSVDFFLLMHLTARSPLVLSHGPTDHLFSFLSVDNWRDIKRFRAQSRATDVHGI